MSDYREGGARSRKPMNREGNADPDSDPFQQYSYSFRSVLAPVAFDVVGALPDPKLAGRKARLVIWTTTPWTLPANLAVSAHPDFAYVAYDLHGDVVVVAKDLLVRFLADVASGELAGKDAPPVPQPPRKNPSPCSTSKTSAARKRTNISATA